jgi:hypothetical protein
MRYQHATIERDRALSDRLAALMRIETAGTESIAGIASIQ